ncbi:phosphoribosylglycinamide formyltransferase [bacterium]|nr:phosphoribosylglycinamide formyltransferase [bacterium]
MRIAIFASGGGSNFQSIVDATVTGNLDAQVVLCVASKAGIGVIDRATRHKIPVFVLNGSVEDNLSELLHVLAAHRVSFIALAGFMKKIPQELISEYPNQIANIHPALLPSFGGAGMYGMHVHRAVLAAGESHSGATVHLVDAEYDSGPIILQESVPVLGSDSPESLAKRVLETEHHIYPKALQLFATGRIRIDGSHSVVIEPENS